MPCGMPARFISRVLMPAYYGRSLRRHIRCQVHAPGLISFCLRLCSFACRCVSCLFVCLLVAPVRITSLVLFTVCCRPVPVEFVIKPCKHIASPEALWVPCGEREGGQEGGGAGGRGGRREGGQEGGGAGGRGGQEGEGGRRERGQEGEGGRREGGQEGGGAGGRGGRREGGQEGGGAGGRGGRREGGQEGGGAGGRGGRREGGQEGGGGGGGGTERLGVLCVVWANSVGFRGVAAIIGSFVPTECSGRRGMWGIFGKPSKRAILNTPGLRAVLPICLRFSSFLDSACVAFCLFLSTGSHVRIQIHATCCCIPV